MFNIGKKKKEEQAKVETSKTAEQAVAECKDMASLVLLIKNQEGAIEQLKGNLTALGSGLLYMKGALDMMKRNEPAPEETKLEEKKNG